MNTFKMQNCNLNIWYYLPDEVWDKVPIIYQKMPGWVGYNDYLPYWFSFDEDEKHICASCEPSGLFLSGLMDDAEWKVWLDTFKRIATEELGFVVGEPEDGYS